MWCRMSTNSVVPFAIKAAQDILWTSPTDNLSEEAAVQAMRNIVRAPSVKWAIDHGNDTAQIFVLRAVNRIVSDEFRSAHDTVNQLWAILDPQLNRSLGFSQNSWTRVGPKKPPAI
jgi:hypothetical protein